MSDTLETLQRKLGSVRELKSVVRTMKALAAANIGQCERAVSSINQYFDAVRLALSASFKDARLRLTVRQTGSETSRPLGVILFGSDQGLVGQFNEVLAAFAFNRLQTESQVKKVWVVGERLRTRLEDWPQDDLRFQTTYPAPQSVPLIGSLITQIMFETIGQSERMQIEEFYAFYNRGADGILCAPFCQRLLPLDEKWRDEMTELIWPSPVSPEVLDREERTIVAFIREYLFVSLFKACAESLASENATRLAAMQRAERNIDELQEELGRSFHQLRQDSIDSELFDVLCGFEVLSKKPSKGETGRQVS